MLGVGDSLLVLLALAVALALMGGSGLLAAENVAEPVFALDEVYYRYPSGALALDGVSLGVWSGESVAVLGANGSGKSTLLRLLDGLMVAQEGAVRAWGEPLGEARLQEDGFAQWLRRRVGFVFQDADAMLFSATVREELAFGPALLGLSAGEVAGRVDDLLRLLSLEPLAERAPYELSGGEKRRVCLAAALSTNPDVLLLDEPTAGLDPRTRDFFTEMLQGLSAGGKTLILATHDLDLAAEVARRALVFCEGHHLIADGPAGAVLRDAATLRQANLISARPRRPAGV